MSLKFCCATTRNDVIVMIYIYYMNHSKIGVYANILPSTSVIGGLLLDVPLAFWLGVYLAANLR